MPAHRLDRRSFLTGTLCLAGWQSRELWAATPKDTLVLAQALDDMITLDPAESFEISTGEIMGNCYDRLLRVDPSNPSQLMGDIARSWTVAADGRTFQFELRPNLRFASGNPLGAQDVVFSLQRAVLLDKSPAFILTQLGLKKDSVRQRVVQTGPLSLSIQIDRDLASSLVYNCLTANVASVVDRQLLLGKETNGDMGHAWLRTQYAGSGPMKILQWRPNELVAMERNDQHHSVKAPMARVIVRHVKESTTQRLLLQKGDIDVARNLSPQDLDAVKANADLKLASARRGELIYLGMNQKNPHLAKPEVREALKWLIDYDTIGQTIVRHIAEVHQNFLPAGVLGSAAERPYRLDLARARALLAKAGLSQGFKLTIDMRTVQPYQAITEALQQSLRQVGIVLEVIPGDGKQTLTRYRARQHDLYLGSWGMDYWDPHTNADAFARNIDNSDAAATKSLAWRNGWDIPDFSRRVDAAVMERDATKRARQYQDLQADFRKVSPFAILFQVVEVAGLRANVDGFKIGPTGESTHLFNVRKR
ncbi:MAG: ABC transporter substrate-binding protein [Betaproteobacteria bacterium]|nr:ABC transporter substrate-binding protein [Betaproteobacteria bacterium]NBU48610.1 ABC transporter substrate-binding protein [Betaproteobacteria bacterium]